LDGTVDDDQSACRAEADQPRTGWFYGVEVHQVVHDLQGALLLDEMVRHVFRIEGGKVKRFDIKSASQLSSIVHGA